MICSKKCSFDAAHFLPNYPGPCQNIHGHHWEVELAVDGKVKENGMVIDFTILKEFLKKQVEDEFDHRLLNDIIINPTAENICNRIRENWNFWRKDKLAIFNLEIPELAYIRVWETENSMVELRI